MPLIFLFWFALFSGFSTIEWQQTTRHNFEGDKLTPFPTTDRTQQMEMDSTLGAHDVGTAAIVAPVGTIQAGDTVLPRASIRNFGTSTERYFDVHFRIGNDYDATVTVNSLPPYSVVELTFPIWVARTGTYVVSCSTRLALDSNPDNDKLTRTLTVNEIKNLTIGPDQNDHIELGQKKSYRFYALLAADTSYLVELKEPSVLSSWTALWFDSTNQTPLPDSDGDGNRELGFVNPNERLYFNLMVYSPSALIGDTSGLKDTVSLWLYGFLSNDTTVKDSAQLKIALLTGVDIHNYPNPLTDRTTFVISLPEPGRVTLTVYHRTGEQICRLLENESFAAGVHLISWDGKNNQQEPVAPGTYHYLFEYQHTNKTERVHKKLVVKRK